MANRRFIDFPIASTVGDNDIVLIWQDGLNKQTTKGTLIQGAPTSLEGLTDVDIAGLINGQILQYNSVTGKWENVDRTGLNLSELGDVSIVSPSNGQVLVYNSTTSKWENSSAGYVPYVGAVTTVDLGAQTIQAGSFVKAGGTAAQFLKANGSVDSNTYLTTGSAAATYVPYTGATADVNLGTHDLTAERGTFANNGSSDTLTVNHTSGSGYGIKVTKGGNNEALYVSKTSGSGNAMAVVGGRTALVDLSLSSVSNATGNFLTISGGVVHQRTPSETRSDVGAQAQLNGTGFVKASGTTISYDNSTYQVTSEKGQPNGYASLDSNGKVPLVQINDALIGNVNFQGLWNASTNTPTLANPPASGTKGYYYIVSTAGTFAGISFEVGDWIISDGTAWGKVDNTDAVSSVFGRTGNVTAANGDYTTAQVTESGNLYYTDGRARGALSFVAGSGAYNSTTGVITIPTNNNQITNGAGYITSAALGGYVQGSGTTNYLPKFTSNGSTIGNSLFTDNGTNGAFGGENYSVGTGVRTFNINASLYPGLVFWANNVTTGSVFSYTFTGNLILSADPQNVFSETKISFETDGTERLSIFQNGNVSISNSPNDNGFKLDVSGTGRFTSNLTAVSFIRSGGTSSQFLKADGSVDSNTYVTGGPFLPLTGGTLTGPLNGTSASFTGDIRSNGIYRDYQGEALIHTSGSDTQIGSFGAGTPRTISLLAGNDRRLFITTSGNVLVGTTNGDIGGSVTGVGLLPAGKVLASNTLTDIYSAPFYGDRRGTNNSGPVFTLAMGGFFKADIGIIGTNNVTNDSVITFNTISGNATRTERVRINSSGRMIIGTTSDNGNMLRVNGTIFSDSSVTATSFFESSDATIKTLIEDAYQAKGIDSVVAKLYIKNGKQELGYYAQDLEGVLPSAVSKGSNGLLNLSYREVHTAKIAYLEQQIKELRNELLKPS